MITSYLSLECNIQLKKRERKENSASEHINAIHGATIQMNKYFRCQKINTGISMQIVSLMYYTD